jgi:hypothetical protein
MASVVALSAKNSVLTEGDLVLNITTYGPYCHGDTYTAVVNVSGGEEPYTYSWDTPEPQNTAMATGLLVGQTYTVTVSDATNTSATATVEIMDDPEPLVVEISATNPTCHGSADGAATSTVTGGTPPYTYLWSNQIDSMAVMNLTAGTYFLLVEDANGCQTRDTIVLVDPDPLNGGSISTTGQTILVGCNANWIMSKEEGSSGGDAVSYRWKANGEVVPDETDISYRPGSAYTDTVGVYNFTREVNDSCNADWLQSDGVWTLTVLDIEITGTHTYCESLGSTTLSGTDSLDTYEWYLNGTLLEGQTAQTLEVTESGDYSLMGTLDSCFRFSEDFHVEEIQNADTIIPLVACDSAVYHYFDTTLVFHENDTFAIDTLKTSLGCDSIIFLDVTIIGNAVERDTLVQEACNSYTWSLKDTTYYESTIDSVVITNYLGCDSIVIVLDLNIHVPNTVVEPFTVCQNEEFFWGNNVQYPTIDPGIYYDTVVLQSMAPYCDSVRILELTVNPTDTTFLQKAACDSFTWPLKDTTYYESTTDSVIIQNRFDCDSVIWLDLTIWDIYDTTFYLGSVCEGDTVEYPYNNEMVSIVAPPMTDTLQVSLHDYAIGSPGCDSLVTYKWSVYQPFDTILLIEECNTYEINGVIYERDTIFEIAYDIDHVCDSFVTYNITLHHDEEVRVEDHICHGDVYSNYGFDINTDTLQGGFVYDYSHEDTTTFGCDSSFYLTLHIEKSYDSVVADPVESCGTYVWSMDSVSQTGYYSQTFQILPYGCDSTVWKQINIYQEYDLYFKDTVCQNIYYENDSLGIYVGFDITSNPGTYEIERELETNNMMRCDSIIHLTLVVNPTYDTIIYDTTCLDVPYQNNGFFNNADTVGDFEIDSSWYTILRCDSTVKLMLTVLPSHNDTIRAHACKGEPWEGFNFIFGHDYVDTVGTYMQTLQSTTNPIGSYKCDSIVTLELSVHDIYQTDTYIDTCISYEYVWDWGQHDELFMTSGIYTRTWHSMTSEKLCDSVVTLHLNLEQMPMVGEIKGESWVNVAPDEHNGIFNYYIDSVPGCLGYEWSLSNPKWILDTVGNTPYCSVIVRTETDETLTVRVYNECGFSERSLLIHPVFTGIEDQMTAPIFSLYPNPAHNKVTIKLGGVSGETSITVYDGKGIRVDQFVVDVDREGTELEYQMGNYANGIYMFHVSTNGLNLTDKVIKK